MLIWKAMAVVLVIMLSIILVRLDRSSKLPWDLRVLRWLSYVLVALATWIVMP